MLISGHLWLLCSKHISYVLKSHKWPHMTIFHVYLLLFPEAFRQSVTVFRAYLVTILKALLKTTKGLLCLDEHSANYITCYSYFSSSWFPKLALPKLKQGNIFLLFATYLNGKLIKYYGFMYSTWLGAIFILCKDIGVGGWSRK